MDKIYEFPIGHEIISVIILMPQPDLWGKIEIKSRFPYSKIWLRENESEILPHIAQWGKMVAFPKVEFVNVDLSEFESPDMVMFVWGPRGKIKSPEFTNKFMERFTKFLYTLKNLF